MLNEKEFNNTCQWNRKFHKDQFPGLEIPHSLFFSLPSRLTRIACSVKKRKGKKVERSTEATCPKRRSLLRITYAQSTGKQDQLRTMLSYLTQVHYKQVHRF